MGEDMKTAEQLFRLMEEAYRDVKRRLYSDDGQWSFACYEADMAAKIGIYRYESRGHLFGSITEYALQVPRQGGGKFVSWAGNYHGTYHRCVLTADQETYVEQVFINVALALKGQPEMQMDKEMLEAVFPEPP